MREATQKFLTHTDIQVPNSTGDEADCGNSQTDHYWAVVEIRLVKPSG